MSNYTIALISIVGFIVCLASFIHHILKISKKIKEYKLTGEVDYDSKTGYSALFPKRRIALYSIYAGCFLFDSVVIAANAFMLYLAR